MPLAPLNSGTRVGTKASPRLPRPSAPRAPLPNAKQARCATRARARLEAINAAVAVAATVDGDADPGGGVGVDATVPRSRARVGWFSLRSAKAPSSSLSSSLPMPMTRATSKLCDLPAAISVARSSSPACSTVSHTAAGEPSPAHPPPCATLTALMLHPAVIQCMRAPSRIIVVACAWAALFTLVLRDTDLDAAIGVAMTVDAAADFRCVARCGKAQRRTWRRSSNVGRS